MTERTLGHYAIVETIGQGAMGTVYRARDTKLGLDVALGADERSALTHATPELERIRADHWARMIADGYALIGRKDDALRWMRVVIDGGYINYPCPARHDPFLESLRPEPEFQQMMAGLKERWESVPESERQPLE